MVAACVFYYELIYLYITYLPLNGKVRFPTGAQITAFPLGYTYGLVAEAESGFSCTALTAHFVYWGKPSGDKTHSYQMPCMRREATH